MSPIVRAVLSFVPGEVHCVRMGMGALQKLPQSELRRLEHQVPVIAAGEPGIHPDFYCLQTETHQVLETGLM